MGKADRLIFQNVQNETKQKKKSTYVNFLISIQFIWKEYLQNLLKLKWCNSKDL